MPAFSFATVYNRFFKLLAENAGLFGLLGLVGAILPTLAISWGLILALHLDPGPWSERFGQMTSTNFAYIAAGSVVVYVLSVINLSMVTEVAIRRAIGKPADIPGVLNHALSNILPIFGISILWAIIAGLGLIVLIIPGLFWILCTCVAVPARVGQPDLGVWSSLQRSFELTRGHRWMLLLIWLVFFVVAGIISSYGAGAMRMVVGGHHGIYQLADTAVQSLFSLISNVFTAAVYVTLRESKDKLTPDMTASVFE